MIKRFARDEISGMILIDLQKAFAAIDHKLLLYKLAFFGFSNVEDDYSDPGDLTCGVPHVSILGPLIFLLYLNDIPSAAECQLL